MNYSTHDLYLAAFLECHGVGVKVEVRGGRAFFTTPISDELQHVVDLFNENTPVPVLNFSEKYRELKSRMHGARPQPGGRP